MSNNYLTQMLHRRHLRKHPNCAYGDKPHFVPPSFWQVGFYLCDPPEELTNRSRERIEDQHES